MGKSKTIPARLSVLILALVLAFAFAGCGPKDENKPKPLMFDAEEASVKAETIDYYWSGDVKYDCFIIKQNGKYGTMDKNGKTVSEPAHENVGINMIYDEKSGATKWGLTLADNDYTDLYYVEANGEVSAVSPNGIGFEDRCEVYWTPEGPIMLIYEIDSSSEVELNFNTYYSYQFITSDAFMSFPGRKDISRVIPVREVTEMNYQQNGDTGMAVPVYKSEKYGLFDFDTKKMLTDFVYDDCTRFAVGGVFAAKRDGKWGYVSDSGKEITGFYFEASFPVEEYESSVRRMFLPVNGYIVTKKDGKYGMINALGETVADNDFDYLSQVSPDGIFWAYKDGKWSRCTPKI